MNGPRPIVRRRAVDIIGKLLFPHAPRDMRQRKLKTLGVALFVALVVAGGIVLVMFKTGGFGER
jgi:hypothetical protein